MSDSDAWVSWEEAAKLAGPGVRVPTIEHAVRVGRIKRRPAHGSRPTLDRESVLEWAVWYRDLKAGQAERRAARQRTASARSSRAARARASWAPLDESDFEDDRWLLVGEAAIALGCSESSVLRWARAGLLDARSAHRSALGLVTGPGGGRAVAVFSMKSIERLKTDRAAESEAWIGWEEAARLVGCSVFPVPALID